MNEDHNKANMEIWVRFSKNSLRSDANLENLNGDSSLLILMRSVTLESVDMFFETTVKFWDNHFIFVKLVEHYRMRYSSLGSCLFADENFAWFRNGYFEQIPVENIILGNFNFLPSEKFHTDRRWWKPETSWSGSNLFRPTPKIFFQKTIETILRQLRI